VTTLSTTKPTASTIVDATVLANNFTAIETVVNGNIDNSNVKTGANIDIAKLAGGSAGQIIQMVSSTPTWVSGAKTTVSSWAGGPPGSPTTGDIWIATAVDASGTAWLFCYNSAEATYKWEAIGGPPVHVTVATRNTLNNQPTYTDLGTSGPAFALGRAGDYVFGYNCLLDGGPSNDNGRGWMAYALSGGTSYSATNADAAVNYAVLPNIDNGPNISMPFKRHDGIAASTTITCKYQAPGSTATIGFQNRRLAVYPVRII
jgi:hypothetical protein